MHTTAQREKDLLRRLITKFADGRAKQVRQSPVVVNALKPSAPFFAIGDIHGHLDLLNSLLAKIDPDENQMLVFLGDYVDRGPQAAGTLARLFDLAQHRPDDVVCLMGNHERMMLDFIDDPLGRGAGWLRNGGLGTLADFGIHNISQNATPDEIIAACDALEAAMPAGMRAWLQQLPLSWNSGNMWCVHAAMDPALPPGAQKTKSMLWGHRDFLNTPRQDGACIVHGHTIVKEPANQNSRIAIDTGAYETGRLTAASIAEDHCVFICADAAPAQ